MDRLEAMSLLLDTLEAGSFSAAARSRGMSVATLTRKVGQLESRVGATLLIRTTRRLTLTEAGQRFAAGARAVLERVHQIEREAAGEFVEPTGRLVVSAPRMFGRLHVLPLVGEFLKQHELISIVLQLEDSVVDLAAGSADLAVRIGTLPDSGLIATRVGSMRAVTVASRELLDHYGRPDRPEDLAGVPTIGIDLAASHDPVLSRYGAGDAPVRARLIVSGAEAAVDAAEAGFGILRALHYQVADAVRTGRLRLLLEAFEAPAAPVHILHAPLMQLPQKTRRFLDFAGDRLRTALLSIGDP